MHPPIAVLRQYGPLLTGSTWQLMAGGLSGATVFRGSSPVGDVVLKRHPQRVSQASLEAALQAQVLVEGLPGVPRVFPTHNGLLVAQADHALWELCEWKAGQPAAAPTINQIRAACQCIAALHTPWRKTARPSPSIPAIDRRLATLAAPLPEKLPETSVTIQELLRQVRAEVPRLAAKFIPKLLAANQPATIHYCHADLHGQHVLFLAEAVSGLIDFSAARLDHPAVDLARYLGDTCGDDEASVAAGMEAYWNAGGSRQVTLNLVRLLDCSGVLGGLLSWLSRPIAPHAVDVVAHRLRRMLKRVANWPGTLAGDILR